MKSCTEALWIAALLSGMITAGIMIHRSETTKNGLPENDLGVCSPSTAIEVLTYDVQCNPSDPISSIQEPDEPEEKALEPITVTVPETTSFQLKTYDIPLDGETQKYLLEQSKHYGVDPLLVLSIIKVESEFKADAVSKSNDWGLMQINYCNHTNLKKLLSITDFLDPKQNILAGIYILWDLSTNYNCDTEEKLLMAYNRGYSGAKRLWKQGITSNTYTQAVANAKAEIKKLLIN